MTLENTLRRTFPNQTTPYQYTLYPRRQEQNMASATERKISELISTVCTYLQLQWNDAMGPAFRINDSTEMGYSVEF